MALQVIILNGVGSAGKGSLAKAVQRSARDWWLHVEMDAFLSMMPEAAFEDPRGMVFVPRDLEGQRVVRVETGPYGAQVLRGMRRAVAALAAAGNRLIVDEVMDAETWQDYRQLLAGYEVALVAVRAPLAVLEQRERQRGDRMIGLARDQVGWVHRGLVYDVEIDSSVATPEACAAALCAQLGI